MSSESLPDFDRMAAVFDRYLPLVAPVSEAVLSHLGEVEGEALDVACGTGEPGLTFARRHPNVRVVGIDAAEGMVKLATKKAEGVSNIRFELMTAEKLSFADGSMSAVMSRFGLMMFGDKAESARQLARVLRPGGTFSVAVWDDMKTNTLVSRVVDAIRPRIPSELLAPFEGLVRADQTEHLKNAGFTDLHNAPFTWHYHFDDEPMLWEFVSGPGVFGKQFAALDDAAKRDVRAELEQAFAIYREGSEGNAYRIPHTCKLHWGRR